MNPTPEKIDVLAIKLVACGNVKAFVSVQVDRLIVHSCRVICQDGKAPWVSLPQQERDGKYFPLVEVSDRQLLERIKGSVLKAYASVGREEELPI